MPMIDPILRELDGEAATTRRVLERVPNERLSWKPHPKSMSLGQLALHVATIPGRVAEMALKEEVEVPDFREFPSPASSLEIPPALDQSIADAKRAIGGLDDAAAHAQWRLTKGGTEIMAVPRIGVIRSIMLNHWYHHRGQLSVYLRLLDVPVPSIYGPSADESPFEVATQAR